MSRPSEPRIDRTVCLALASAFVIGLAVRLPHFQRADFVLNDGALFLRMSEAIQAAGFRIPAFVIYNDQSLPFAYPPLSFFLTAGIHALTGVELIDLVRYLPLAINLLCVALFPLLVHALYGQKFLTLCSALIFPLLPKSYEWLVMGGGLTRSTGFLFALLSILAFSRLSHRPSRLLGLACALLVSATFLSHLEWGITAAVSGTLLYLARQPSLASLRRLAFIGLGSLVFASPWWVSVLGQHGAAPFLAAAHTGEWTMPGFEKPSLAWRSVPDLMKIPMAFIVTLGAILLLWRRQVFPLVWIGAVFLTTPRHGPTVAAMPLALISAAGIVYGLAPLARLLWQSTHAHGARMNLLSAGGERGHKRLVLLLGTALGALLTLYLGIHRQSLPSVATPLLALTAEERSAMAWIADNTSPRSTFVVLSTTHSWQEDRVAEWFPVLADRTSLTTVQGLEWMPDKSFEPRVRLILSLKRLQHGRSEELEDFLEKNFAPFDYLAIFLPRSDAGIHRLARSSRFMAVFASANVTIFRRLRQATAWNEPHP